MFPSSDDFKDYHISPSSNGVATVVDRGGQLVGWVSMTRTSRGPRWTMTTLTPVRSDAAPTVPTKSAEGAVRAWLSWSRAARRAAVEDPGSVNDAS